MRSRHAGALATIGSIALVGLVALTVGLAHPGGGHVLAQPGWDPSAQGLILPLVGRFDGTDFARPPVRDWRYFGRTDYTNDVAIDARDGTAWLATGNGLVRLDPQTGKMRQATFKWVDRVAVDRGGGVWISGRPDGSADGVSRLDPGGTWRHFGLADGLAEGVLWNIVADEFGSIWLAYGTTNWQGDASRRPLNGGLTRVTADWTVTTFGLRDGWPDQSVSAVVPDRSGGVWLTLGDIDWAEDSEFFGIVHLAADGRHEVFTPSEGLPTRLVGVTAVDLAGAPIVVSLQPRDLPDGVAGAYRRDQDGSWRQLPLPEGAPISPTGIRFVAAAPDGSMWFSADMALMRVKPDGSWRSLPAWDDGTLEMGELWGAMMARGMAFGPDGSAWLGRDTGAPIAQLRPDDRWVIHRSADAMAGATDVRQLEIDADGGVWFGVDGRRTSDGQWTSTASAGRHYDTTALAVDAEGGLWASTWGSVVRLATDGRRDVFDARHGFPRSRVDDLVVAPDGTIWAATDIGAARWTGDGLWATVTVTDGLATPLVRAIATAPGGETWFACASEVEWTADHSSFVVVRPAALSRLDPEGRWATWRHDALLGTSVVVAEGGEVWSNARDGVVRLAPDGAWTFVALPTGTEGSAGAGALAIDAGGNLWAGTVGGSSPGTGQADGAGAYRLARDGTWQRFGRAEGLPFDWVRDILADPDGAVWLAGGSGETEAAPGDVLPVARIAPDGTVAVFHLSPAWPSENPDDLYAPTGTTTALVGDGRGRIVVAGYDRVLHRLAPDGTFTTLYPHADMHTDGIYDLRADAEGGVWAATARGAAHWTPADGWRTYHTDDGLPTGRVRAVLPGATGGVWLGFAAAWDVAAMAWRPSGASYRAADGGWRHVALPADGPGQGVQALAVDPRGGLWLATHRASVLNRRYALQGTGLSYLAPDGTWRHFGMSDGLPAALVTGVVVDAEGAVWAGTSSGVARRLSDGEWRVFGTRDGLGSRNVRSLSLDRHGRPWAATSGGASRYTGTTWVTLTEGDGLSDNHVNDIAFDAAESAWFATEAGGVSVLADAP